MDMYVNGMGPNGARGPEGASGPRPPDGADGVDGARNGTAAGRERSDKVEISAEGRALAAAETEEVGLLPQLVVRMRGRLASGFYDRPDVMAETARRMLESGDL